MHPLISVMFTAYMPVDVTVMLSLVEPLFQRYEQLGQKGATSNTGVPAHTIVSG